VATGAILVTNGTIDSKITFMDISAQNLTVTGDLSDISILGNFVLFPNSTVSLVLHASGGSLNISGCANFSGILRIDLSDDANVAGDELQLFNYKCYSGSFSEIIATSDKCPGQEHILTAAYYPSSLNVFVSDCDNNSVNSNLGIILGATLGGLALLGVIFCLLGLFVRPLRRQIFPFREKLPPKP